MLQIEELILKIPGLKEEEAGNLGKEVVRRIAEELPVQNGNIHLGKLDLKLTIPAGATRSQMAKLIAEAILRGLA